MTEVWARATSHGAPEAVGGAGGSCPNTSSCFAPPGLRALHPRACVPSLFPSPSPPGPAPPSPLSPNVVLSGSFSSSDLTLARSVLRQPYNSLPFIFSQMDGQSPPAGNLLRVGDP